MDAVTSLRKEAPALGLTLGFSPAINRPPIADALLLWLEVRRALLADENLVAAARMAWWRDALAEARSEGVPLAERLIAHGGLPQLAEGLDAQINTVLHGTASALWHESLSCWLAQRLEIEPGAPIIVFERLEAAFAGTATPSSMPVGQASLDLIGWCCEKPSRLRYPESHQLLALQMIFVAFRLPRHHASH
jgi:hypothetical protein